jgi:hypothetical protein
LKIPDRTTEKYSSKPAQDWISQEAVEHWHGTWTDPSLEAVPHDKLIPLIQPTHKISDLRKVVTVVRITHDNVFAARSVDPTA